MFRKAWVFVLLFAMTACKDNDKKKGNSTDGAVQGTGKFREASLPYQLTDTGLTKNNDTTSLSLPMFTTMIPDSIRKSYFGKTVVKLSPIAKFPQKEEMYYLVK